MGKADAGRVDAEALRDALTTLGVEVADLEFTPSWEGTSYLGSDANGRRYSIKAFDPEWRPPHLEETLEGASLLYGRCGLKAVVPPIRLADGSLALEVCEHAVAVFELIEGSSLMPAGLSTVDRRDAAEVLRALHASGDCLSGAGATLPKDGDSLALGFSLLDSVQRAAEKDDSGDDAVREAAHLIRSSAGDIGRAVDRLRHVAQAGHAVPTHGDLNPGNFIRQVGGALRIIDWTKLAFGTRERDLVPFTDAHLPEFLCLYLAEPHTFELGVANFEHYIWRERLASVIDYGSLLLLEDAPAEDRAHALSELRRVLPIDNESISRWIAWIRRCLAEAG